MLFRIDAAGDVEQRPAEFLRSQLELASGDVVDGVGDPGGLGLLRRQQRSSSAADLEQAHKAALVPAGVPAMADEGEHRLLIGIPGPEFAAVVSKRAKGLREKGRRAQAALAARRRLLPL
jgi:hypothetical protein